MNVLVTGGAGFIGANFLHYVVNKYPNDRWFCIDALTHAGNMETIESILGKPNFQFVKGNICDLERVFTLFSEVSFDCVINFAAETHVDRSVDTPEPFLRSNYLGVGVLLEACRKYGIGRFHQVSTDEVYGDLPLDRPDLRFTENSPIKPSSPYSASKAAADLLTLSYYRTFGLPVTISRCSNNYGPYQFPEKLIPLVISKAKNGEPIPIYGKGENVRDWLHVLDHCTAIDLIVRKGKPGEIYNVGGDSERTNLQVVRTILACLGQGEELISFVKDRPGHDLRYAIDHSKISRELGWMPSHRFEDGIRNIVRWNLENEIWLSHVRSGEYRLWMEKNYQNR